MVNKAGLSIGFASPSSGSYIVTILIRVKNQCGLWSEWTPGNYHIVQNCSWMFTVSPNPSSSQIEVTIDNSNTAYEKSKPVYTSNFISEIQIADMSGNVVSKQRYDGRQSTAVLSISNLRPDVYFIRVFNGNEWKTQKIIKN
ncbi:hypothetical protein HY58_11965 [Flavihumibacter sp. ZG627]|nr:hypothetical protein HY58_11965 [Flavihumibacter sp. ZG627]